MPPKSYPHQLYGFSNLEDAVHSKQRAIFGERYVGASLSKLSLPTHASEKIIQFVKSPKNFLVFCGNPGIGKTYLCASFTEWLLMEFSSFRYWHEDKLLQRVRDGISEGNGDYFRNLSYLIDDPVIILDDLGCNKPNEWREEIIFHTLDERYNSTLPTIITTNLTKQDFQKKYHHRIASRLFAKENNIIELHNGEDLRECGK